MNQFLTTIGKLAMDSDNDSAVGDVFIAKPKPELKNRLGTIIGIMELFGQPDEFADKIFEIIKDLETEYYLPPFDNDGGIEQRFEECLGRANRRINRLVGESTSEIELKNINILLALINKNKIYLSQIGKNNALLFHRKKKHDYLIVDIFAQAGEKHAKINQEKMFSNIINGTISEKDNLLFCNDSILEFFSQNELMEINTANGPAQAFKEMQKKLESENGNNNFYAIAIEPESKEEETDDEAIIIRQTEKPNPENRSVAQHTVRNLKTPPQASINRLISTQEDTEKYLVPSMAPNWKKILIIFGLWLKKMAKLAWKYSQIAAQKLIDASIAVIDYLKEKIPELISQISAKIAKKEYVPKLKKTEKEIDDEDLEIDDEVDLADEPKTPLQLPPARNITQKISNFLNTQIARFLSFNRWQQFLLVAAIVLVFLFSQSMVWQGRAKSVASQNNVSDTIAQIEEAINNGEAQNIFNDEAGANASLQSAIDLLAQIPDNFVYRDKRAELQEKIDQLTQSLQKMSYLENPEVASDLANQNAKASIVSITKFENFIYAFDSQNKNFYRVDLTNKQTTAKQAGDALNDVKKIVALDKSSVLVLNGDKTIYQYNFDTNSTEIALTTESPIKDFDLYGGKLYTLQPEKNQIYKHFPEEQGYNSGSAWVKDSTDLKNMAALTLDGGVYLADNQGKIKHLVSGKSEESKISENTLTIGSLKQIFSRMESSYVYALDQTGNKIIVFEKTNGSTKIQYTSKDFTDSKSMAIEEKDKKLYLLSGQKIYSVGLNF